MCLKYVRLSLFLGFIFLANAGVCQQNSESSAAVPKLLIFHSATCHRCHQIKAQVLSEIESRFKGKVELQYRNIDDIENYKFLLRLQEKYPVKITNTWPVFYFEGHFLNGVGPVKSNLIELISRPLPYASSGREPVQLPSVDLIERFRDFTLLTVASAGLIDGINPCAFTVIVFFISYLALQGYRKRQLVAIGFAFIVAVFLTYLMLGVGCFGFLYRLKNFWLVARVLNIAIGVFSIVLGILALHDFFKIKKTGAIEDSILQLPQAVKAQIHKLIGIHYRKSQSAHPEVVSHQSMVALITSALVTGFLVSILEVVCTGQVYLPTITFVLKTSALKLQALGYLVFYNFMFVVPLLLIFLLALGGVTSSQFAGFLKRHILSVKMAMAVVFFGLGLFLVWGW